MGEGQMQILQVPTSQISAMKIVDQNRVEWNDTHNTMASCSSSSSSSKDSNFSNGSTLSSCDTTDDASSSSTHSNGSSFDLSDLMSQLPIKRGLSKFYQGKSESFTSLRSVTSIEDLPKKENLYKCKRKIKGSKSYGGGLDTYKSHTLPKPTISKKNSRSSFSSGRRSSFSSVCRPPLVPAQNSL